MEVAVERPAPVKEEKRAETKPDMVTQIGSALPIVFESFQSAASMKQEGGSRLDAARAEMGEVREENERLKAALSRIVSDYKSLQMHFLDVVKVHDGKQATKATKLPVEPAPPVADDDLVFLSLGTRGAANGSGRKGHERSASSGSGSGTADDDSHLSLGLGFARGSSRPSADDEKAAGPVLNLSSDSSSADDAAAKPADAKAAAPGESSRKSPSGGDGGADDEVQQQQAKKARVSVRVKCDTPTMPDGCQWRKYGQKISKGNPCPRAYYRCTVAPNCPVRKQVQRCAEDKAILITTYEGAHNHQLQPAATAMASTTSAAAAMLTAGSTTSSFLAGRHHLPPGLLGPTTMVSTAASCPTITLDLTAPHSSPLMMQHASSPYAAGYESKPLPAAWSSGYPAAYGGQPPSYYAAKTSSAAMAGHLFAGGLSSLSRPAEELFGGGHSSPYLQRTTSLGGGAVASPVVTDTIAKALASDPSFQSALATMITSYMGRGEAAQK